MANGLPDNKIEKIYFDESGTLWIGTPKGIARFDGRSKFTPYLFVEPQRINDICFFRDQIYVASNKGLYKLDTLGVTLDGEVEAA